MKFDSFISWTSWEDFINWFDSISTIEQTIFTVFLVMFWVSLTVLICIGVFYLVKYAILGIYYLLKWIFTGIYIGFKKLYDLIAGMSTEETSQINRYETNNTVPSYSSAKTDVRENIEKKTSSGDYPIPYSFCTNCGNKFSRIMFDKLRTSGVTYCIHCGEGCKLVELESIKTQITHVNIQ